MASRKHDLINDIVDMQQEMMRSFQEFLVSNQPIPSLHSDAWAPPTDVYETKSTIIVRMEIPGINPNEIHVSLEDKTLVVQGKREDPARKKKVQFQQMEIHYGSFQQAISLPSAVDDSQIQATYNDGFLELVIPKSSKKNPTKVRIKT